MNFKKLLLDFKMKKAAELLKTTNKSITMISSELGYVYASYFIKVFKNYFGVTPKQFLKNSHTKLLKFHVMPHVS
ncbi:helix-turn-helix transcriptional regulator [Salmonella enterica]|uniref:helix-turn-helix transcriptional regulator n=1 Tax=Salmonella enterica TaxID=28901 RepID=UPI0034E9639E